MLPISHHLMAAPDGPGSLEEIKAVYSHPQSFGQCRDWLRNHLPDAEIIEVSSNARAAEIVAEEHHSAAIAPRLCAGYYGLRILQSDLQDAYFNQTRFFVIYKHKPRWPVPVFDPDEAGQPVTAIMISIKDRVGALHAVTGVFTKYGLNMNRIESRPSKQKAWDYVFFIEFDGQPTQTHVAAALRELATETTWAKVLGWWTRSKEQ
jgi:chorismate mutase/prephenate dehydratase